MGIFAAQEQDKLTAKMSNFNLHILGCGSAKPTLRHNPTCQVVEHNGNLYMVDCGEGAQTMMARMHLRMSRLQHIFISHLHGDHCFGLPGLVSTMALHGKGGSITIHIFKDGAELFGNMFRYFVRDIPMQINFDIIEYGNHVIYEDSVLKISTIPLKHRVPAVGFLFEEKPKLRHINGEMAKFHQVPLYMMNSIREGADFVKPDGTVVANSILTTAPTPSVRYAYCSDTMPASKIAPVVEGVDWMYHEATYANDNIRAARERFHSTAEQAATLTRDANVGNLIIGHYSSRYDDETVLLSEARSVYPRTILADEGMHIDLLKGFDAQNLR